MAEIMNAEAFAEIMNDAITKADIKMLIEMPEGTQEVKLSGTGIAPVDFYIVVAVLKPVFVQLIKDMGGSENVDAPGILDGIWQMLKSDVLEELKEAGV